MAVREGGRHGGIVGRGRRRGRRKRGIGGGGLMAVGDSGLGVIASN